MKKRTHTAVRAGLMTAFGLATVAATVGASALGLTAPGGAGAPAAHAADATSAAAGAATTSQPALGSNWYASAPYLMPDDNNPPDISTVMKATGQKAFQLAFILADNGCTAAWNGTTPVGSDPAVAAAIQTIRAAGGDVSVSQGGYAGTKLGQACSSAADEAAALQTVIDHYDLHAIDFDLEEPEYENLTAVDHELGAAQILQQDNPGLYVSVTMPGTPAGTGYFGENVLKTAKGLGFTPANFSIMPFDNGINGAAATTAALTAFNGLLQKDLGWSAATAWAHEGFSGMDGRSDTGEMFSVQDFSDILAFAQQNGMARYTFWSVNRDRPCASDETPSKTWGDCSSTDAAPWSYTAETVAFAKNATPVPPGGGTTPPEQQCAAAWSAAATYNAGDEVSSGGHDWTAKWWTSNQTPGSAGVWSDDGPCQGEATPPPSDGGGSGSGSGGSGTCAAAWDSSAVYTGGDEASYGGDDWKAQWWTQGQQPGSAAVWVDEGACTAA